MTEFYNTDRDSINEEENLVTTITQSRPLMSGTDLQKQESMADLYSKLLSSQCELKIDSLMPASRDAYQALQAPRIRLITID